jgi:hypothetical protein
LAWSKSSAKKCDGQAATASAARCRDVLRMVKPITISEIARIPLIDALTPAYQYVNLVLDAVLRADTIDPSDDNRPVRHASQYECSIHDRPVLA